MPDTAPDPSRTAAPAAPLTAELVPGKRSDPLLPVRRGLTAVGRHLGPKALANLRSVLSYLEIGAWLQQLPADQQPRAVPQDVDLFAEAARRVTGTQPLYLEFGVYAGRSIRWWSQNLPAPGAHFVGFDSFEGLPEDWRPGTPQGHFATGQIPQINDPRVSFVKGWFDETLPGFRVPDHDQLIVNIDSDLYSSADTVLRWVEPYLKPGTLLYFDEFADRDHEMRALNEFVARTGAQVRPIAYARGGIHWLFEYV
ncbi:MAG: class I SAM-dependent methyltransferase [Actinomycetota bacterium]|nr:class I SAM-dependent methyltransferase [Actinomycetota bacterium]